MLCVVVCWMLTVRLARRAAAAAAVLCCWLHTNASTFFFLFLLHNRHHHGEVDLHFLDYVRTTRHPALLRSTTATLVLLFVLLACLLVFLF